jgi:putative nucleotidyltransferase with HDIG domain
LSGPRLEVLGTRVARRVLFLFTIGAAVPVAVMAVLSFAAISSQLRQQGEERLSQFTSVAVQSILERLIGFRTILQSAGSLADLSPSTLARTGLALDSVPLPSGVEGIALDVDGRLLPIVGTVGSLFELSPERESRLSSGGAVMGIQRGPGDAPIRALMAVPFTTNDGGPGRLWARIIADSIWAPVVTQASDPSIGDMCILDSAASPLYCMSGPESSLADSILPPGERASNSGRLELEDEEGTHLVAWKEVYLRSPFDAPSWTVVVSQPASSVYGAGDAFVYNLLLTILIGLSAALLLTHVLVRRTMEPLQKLTEGTERIARHDLTTRVDIESQDEFADLAMSFNTMAERLGLQFRQLEVGRAIDHAAITATDQTDAIQALLEGVGDLVPSSRSGVLLPETELPGTASLFMLDRKIDTMIRSIHVGGEADHLRVLGDGNSFVAEREEDVPDIFRPWVGEGRGPPLLILPLQIQGEPIGVIAVASDSGRGFTDADSRRAKHLADRAAVALEKLRLDKELASMTWEVLRALANAIDAKSEWTTGHSERVTGLCLRMGNELGLETEDMNILHRGGLLHDIGKIGVPLDVLDFDGGLDDEMRAIMEEHPTAGARILEPVRAFQPILPIVLYHHERWDGSGYPEGLKGLEIPRLARLLAVADVFDAMVSARPYRSALDPGVVLNYIRDSSDVAFDPEMVQVLVRVMEAGWTPQDTAHVGVSRG